METFALSTRARTEMVDITRQVEAAVDASGVSEGAATVFIPHTTAGVSINENADPDVVRDVMYALERAVPNEGFAHFEGNSDAHTKAQLTGFSVTVIVEDSKLQLGTWQSIYFCEFDGPRTRKVYVQAMGC